MGLLYTKSNNKRKVQPQPKKAFVSDDNKGMVKAAYRTTLIEAEKEKGVQEVLVKIVQQSRVANQLSGISGVALLNCERKEIFHYLEGEKKAVSALLKKIKADTRQKGFEQICFTELDERKYPKPGMNLAAGKHFEGTIHNSFSYLISCDSEIMGLISPEEQRTGKSVIGMGLLGYLLSIQLDGTLMILRKK